MSNNIDHPSHYNREGAIECLEEMEKLFGIKFVMNFCLGNVWKYRYRAGQKKDEGVQDLKKSDWYMNKYFELEKKEKLSKNDKSYSISSFYPMTTSTNEYPIEITSR